MILLETLKLCAFCALAGGVFFERLIPATGALERTVTARLRWLSWAIIVALVAGALRFVFQRYGGVQTNTAVWLVFAELGLLLVLRKLLGDRAQGGWPATIAALALLAAHSAGSRSAGLGVLQAAGDWLHLALAAMWLGGVAYLAVITLTLARTPAAAAATGPAAELRTLSTVVGRFSPLAMFCVAGLIIGGVAQAAAFFDSVEAVTTTAYGQALSTKLGVALALIGFGAFHQQIAAPRLRRSALAPADDLAGAGVRRLRVTLWLEAAVGAALIALVALMKLLPAWR
jgi:putative copper export protein